MMRLKKIKAFLRLLGWSFTGGSLAWGGSYYWRFHNPAVDAFRDVSTQLAALESAGLAWRTVGYALIFSAFICLTLGYLGGREQKSRPVEQRPIAEEKSKRNVVEGT